MYIKSRGSGIPRNQQAEEVNLNEIKTTQVKSSTSSMNVSEEAYTDISRLAQSQSWSAVRGTSLLGNTVRRLRKRQSITLADLADVIGVSREWQFALENGSLNQVDISDEVLGALSKALHMDILPLKIMRDLDLFEDDSR